MATDTNANPADWQTYESLAYGIDTNRLPQTDALEGSELEIVTDDGTLDLRFADRQVTWSESNGASGSDPYDAVEVAPDTYFLDIWRKSHDERDALTLIVDRTRGRSLSILTHVREQAVPGEPIVTQTFTPGTLAGVEPAGPAPEETRDLLGKRLFNDYSPNHYYEHVYINSKRYCWQCLKGVQQGHGDVDMASYWRFNDDQYLFTFREFRIPVASVLFLNFQTKRNTGKFLGLESDGQIKNGQAGAVIELLSETRYPDGVEPV